VLGVSQGGLTKSIAALEEEYGVDLFDRSAKGILLTPQGEAFMPLARAIVEEADRADQWLRGCGRGLAASVAVGASLEPSLTVVPSVLRDFRRAMPNVTVRLVQGVASELLTALRENRIELAITIIPRSFDSTDLRVERLYQSAPVVAARAGHPLRNATSIRELLDCDWMVVGDASQQGADRDDSVWELFDREGLGRPRFAVVCSSVFGLIPLLMESDALARVPKPILDHVVVGKGLVEIPLKEPSSAHAIAVVSKASRRLTPEAQMLSAMLGSYARISSAMKGA
jgi:DNA-binding transcriptional LysR family regulator